MFIRYAYVPRNICSVSGAGEDTGGGGAPDANTPDTAPAQQSTEDTATPFDKFVEDTSRPSAPAQTQTPASPDDTQTPARQAPAQPAAPQQTGLPHERGLRRTNTGDLVNADGQLVARAGTESRHWQRANDAAREIATMRSQVQELSAANEAFRTAASTFTALGLQPQEMTAAANLMANWKQSPINVLKYLLTEAQAAGHDLSSILGGGAALDPNAIRRIVQEAVAPLTNAQQEQHRVTQAHNNAAQEYTQFAQQYPEALVQEEEIASMMRRFPDLSAEAAHLRLHNYALQNGFDYSQPLRPQIEARRSGAPAPNGSPPQPANRSVLPASRGIPASGGMTDMRTAAAPATASTRDIVAEALREAGIHLQ